LILEFLKIVEFYFRVTSCVDSLSQGASPAMVGVWP